ncbi:hypothetical protein B0H13DRAFT_1180361 [Mycena leptocephala]|nr:hypothetical protein B0H13DRAFT_1180361 [Mycena leptocephala]
MDSFVHVHPHPQRTTDTEGNEGRQGARAHRVHALLQLLAVCQKGQGHQALHPVIWPRALLSGIAVIRVRSCEGRQNRAPLPRICWIDDKKVNSAVAPAEDAKFSAAAANPVDMPCVASS